MTETESARPTGAQIVLGTAQLGLNYGATNTSGLPSDAEVFRILEVARRHNIRTLDTARAYGESEARIGQVRRAWQEAFPFEIVTKLAPMASLNSDDVASCRMETLKSVQESMEALGTDYLPCLLLHRPEHRTTAGGAVWKTLLDLRDEGRIGRLGVSLSTPSQLLDAMCDSNVEHIQIPYNCLDDRFEAAAVQEKIAARSDVTIHVRSVLLQGLIASAGRSQFIRLFPACGQVVHEFLEELPSLAQLPTRLAAAIAYVRSVSWIDGLVIGVAKAEEIPEVAATLVQRLDADRLAAIRARRPKLDESVLNPAMWNA